MSELMEPYITIWQVLTEALLLRANEAKMRYGLRTEDVEIIPSPLRTIAIRSGGVPRVQASISLTEDRIDIKARRMEGYTFNEALKPINIEVVNNTTIYTHDGQRLAGAEGVADIILGPVLDDFRAAA